MNRVLALIPRKPDLSREAFRDHYETVHAPLGMSVLGDIPHYLRDHIVGSIGATEPSFDVLSQFGYADSTQMKAMSERLATKELGDPIRADERNFLDKSRIAILLLDPIGTRTESRATAAPTGEAEIKERGGEAIRKLVLLEKAAPGTERTTFVRRHLQSVDALRGAASSASFECTDPRAPYDVVSFIWLSAEFFYPKDANGANDTNSLRRELVSSDQSLLLAVDECATRFSTQW